MADTATLATDIDPVAKPKPPRSARGALFGLLLLVIVVGAGAYGFYWLKSASRFVATDNAYVGAETAQITPLIGAPVAGVPVRETQVVNVGDVLVELDSADARLALAQAQADVARARADASRATVDLTRRRALAPGGAVSGDELSAAENASSTARAMLTVALARLEAAELALTRTTLRAPIAGVVSHKNVQVGQRVEAGTPLMIIAPITNAYVDANFKEVQLRGVSIGQPVTLTSDLYGDKVTYHGTVTGLSGGTGAAFSLIPAQNASGNWIKVVQRVPVRIALDPAELAAHPLRVGLSMSARIDISGVR